MNLVKEYKGVKIFISTNGEFYCDTISNSNDYKKKTFVSVKLQSIEKAIDNFEGQNLDGNEYYYISQYPNEIKLLKVVKNTGNRFFFDDGTDTINRGSRLYPKIVEETAQFKDLEVLFDTVNNIQKEINKLYLTQRELNKTINNKLKYLSKVNVE